MGFRSVYDYSEGKEGWTARGGRLEGTWATVPRVRDAMQDCAICCHLDDVVDAVRGELGRGAKEIGIVVGGDGVVLGRLDLDRVERADPASPVRSAMIPGPSTWRPDVALEELVERMDRRGSEIEIVTTPDGAFLGTLTRQDAANHLAGNRVTARDSGTPSSSHPAKSG